MEVVDKEVVTVEVVVGVVREHTAFRPGQHASVKFEFCGGRSLHDGPHEQRRTSVTPGSSTS